MHELYRRLSNEKPLIIAGNWVGDDTHDQQHSAEIEVHRMNLDFPSWGVCNPWNLYAYLQASKKIASLAKNKSIKQIHAACCLPEGLMAWFVAKRIGVPYLTYVHGEELNVASSSRELKWLARRVYRDAQTIVANSNNTASLLAEDWLPSGARPKVLTPGIDTATYHPARNNAQVRNQLGWGDRRVVLTVGRLQKRKGHDRMLQALPAIRAEVPDVLYAIVGDGDESNNLVALANELGVQESVRFYNALEGDRLLAAYQQCDLFALPNREVEGDIEGFGIVLLEAQACGKPVIAGNSGGTSETFLDGETGFLVDATSPEKLAEAVLKAFRSPGKLEEMGASARDWTVRNFDWCKLSARAEAMFAMDDQQSSSAEAAAC